MLFSRIEKLRKVRKLSQDELAEKVGRTREWYGAKKRSDNIMTDDLAAIAKILNVPMIYFFEEAESTKKQPKEYPTNNYISIIEEQKVSFAKVEQAKDDVIAMKAELIDDLREQVSFLKSLIEKDTRK